MTDLTRRSVLAGAAAGAVALGASAVAKAAEFGNPDSPLQGAINSTPAAISEPGPQNPQPAAARRRRHADSVGILQ
jgi:oxalate decarboxylase